LFRPGAPTFGAYSGRVSGAICARVLPFVVFAFQGVYQKTENATYLGDHSAKLIGWGVKYDVEYWLLVNSWGDDWGDGGLFKIRKGTNECYVDNSTTGGVPADEEF